MKSIYLYNLGCSKNVIDGENILGLLKASGFIINNDPEDADIIIVNTCAFIIQAKQEAIDTILEAAEYKKNGVCTTLIVAGCFSQRYREDVSESFPEVDLWLGVNNWEEQLKGFFSLKEASFYRELSGTPATEYIKISEGCSHSCSFCVIPNIRGGFRSRSIDSVVKEAQLLQDKGVKELILVSQDTSFYGRDVGTTLSALLQSLLKECDIKWIRTMYLHPAYVDNRLIEIFAAQERICSYFDIPIQHISDRILTSMGRRPLSAGIKNMVTNIRNAIPSAALRTSFILGYPGESEDDFNNLVEFVEESRFDKVGVFPFSPEEGTRAFGMDPVVDEETANERCSILMDVQREISSELLRARRRCKELVKVDAPAEEQGYDFEARTEYDAPEIDGRLFLKSNVEIKPGDMVYADITGSDDYDLFGRLDKKIG